MMSIPKAGPLIAVTTAVALTLIACRALGFGDGLLLGVTPASGLAIVAALLLRGPGAAAAALGFALASGVWGLGPVGAGIDAAAHGLAALAAASAMRALARRRTLRSRTSDWLIFLCGIVVFTAVVAAVSFAASATGVIAAAMPAARAAALSAVFEPLGLLCIGAAALNLRDLRDILNDPMPAVLIAGLSAILLGMFWLLLGRLASGTSASGLVLVLAVPLSLWIAMQRRSLDGAVLSFLTAHVALLLLVRQTGGIDTPEFVTAVVYLTLLVATSQLVHVVNLDRLQALAEVEARVESRTARLKAMMERAMAADAAKTRFLATVSHEVRTPMTGVLGMTSVVLEADLDPLTRRNVEIIRTSGFHMLDVINRILDFSQLDGGRSAPRIAAFDLASAIDEVLSEARFLPYAQGISLRMDIGAGLDAPRLGDRQILRQVLTNLVGNAAKFTDEGNVTVRAAPLAPDWVRIEVSDTGIGIAPDDIERVFLPYEQAEGPAARRKGGTGLGLAICADAVRRMGGRIGAASALRSGSTFWIELPLPVAATTQQVEALG